MKEFLINFGKVCLETFTSRPGVLIAGILLGVVIGSVLF